MLPVRNLRFGSPPPIVGAVSKAVFAFLRRPVFLKAPGSTMVSAGVIAPVATVMTSSPNKSLENRVRTEPEKKKAA